MATAHSAGKKFRVVIAGGGIAALEAAAALHALAADRTEVTLISPEDSFHLPYAELLEPFAGGAPTEYPTARLAEDLNFEHHADRYRWVNPGDRVVHTTAGVSIEYDALLLASGARRRPRFHNAVTLTTAHMAEQVTALLADVDAGRVRSVALIVPSQPSWPLPLYELALMLSTHAVEHGVELAIHLVTPEDAPLAVLGHNASRDISYLLRSYGISVHAAQHCQVHEPGIVWMHPSGSVLRPDAVIALPELFGSAIPGIPTSAVRGFISVDPHGAVRGLSNVFAAGDATNVPIKHGSIAAAQADAAAGAIAALAGAPVEPKPARLVTHAVLLGARSPIYVRAQVSGDHGSISEVSLTPLWDTGAKLHARYLSPYLQQLDAARATV